MRCLLYTSKREGATRHYGTKYEGVIPNLWRRFRESTSDYVREKLEEYMVDRPCRVCEGTRLQPVARAVDVAGVTIVTVTKQTVVKSLDWALCLDCLLYTSRCV